MHGNPMHNQTVLRCMARGFLMRCPNCGRGKLFGAFLKPVAACGHCQEQLGHIRADDGPAWLTIMLVGHIIVPALFVVQKHVDWADWVAMIFWSCMVILLSLLLLPRSKGLFIAFIWNTKSPGSDTP